MEILILLSAPTMVALMAAVHVWAPVDRKPFSLVALVFMAMAALVTCSVHFSILTVSHQADVATLPCGCHHSSPLSGHQ
jgi:hypothetical protein